LRLLQLVPDSGDNSLGQQFGVAAAQGRGRPRYAPLEVLEGQLLPIRTELAEEKFDLIVSKFLVLDGKDVPEALYELCLRNAASLIKFIYPLQARAEINCSSAPW
jgi:hypothetical protein